MDLSFLNDVNSLNLFIYLLFGGGGIGFLWKVLKDLWGRTRLAREKKFASGLRANGAMSSIVSTLRDNDDFSHVILFFGRDHGGIPDADHPFYLSPSFYSVPRLSNLPEGAIRLKDLDEVLAGHGDYCTLVKLLKQEEMIVDVKNVAAQGSIIASYFESHGVKKVYLSLCGISYNSLFFLCVAKDTAEKYSPKEIENIKFAVDKIKCRISER